MSLPEAVYKILLTFSRISEKMSSTFFRKMKPTLLVPRELDHEPAGGRYCDREFEKTPAEPWPEGSVGLAMNAKNKVKITWYEKVILCINNSWRSFFVPVEIKQAMDAEARMREEAQRQQSFMEQQLYAVKQNFSSLKLDCLQLKQNWKERLKFLFFPNDFFNWKQ